MARAETSSMYTWTYFLAAEDSADERFTWDEMKDIMSKGTRWTVMGLEVCPTTKRKHIQGVSYLFHKKTLSAFKLIVDPSIACFVSKGTADHNRDYCGKGEQSKDEWDHDGIHGEHYGLNAEVWEWGDKPAQGKRTDLHDLQAAVETAHALNDVLDIPAVIPAFARHGRFAERVHAHALAKRTREYVEYEVIVLWGRTSVGKTRRAYEEGAYMFNPGGTEWWDGYDGEDVLCIDDFYGQIQNARMLQLLRGYQCRLPVKGSFTYAQWTKVYITSNCHPDEWYTSWSGIPEKAKEAFFARINSIIEMV